jgi:hypothetical protein
MMPPTLKLQLTPRGLTTFDHFRKVRYWVSLPLAYSLMQNTAHTTLDGKLQIEFPFCVIHHPGSPSFFKRVEVW